MPPSITWGTLKVQIARKLNDASYQKYSEVLLLDSVNDALVHFAAAHTGLASDFTLTGDGTAYVFDLPSNIVDAEQAGIYAVQWTDQRWIYEERYWPGMALPGTERTTTSVPMAFFLWPVDKISFTRVPGNGDAIILHYIAYYPDIADDDSTVQVPIWAREAVKAYVCAEALVPGSTKTSNLRQYQSRREAGRPEDNPLYKQAMSYLTRYYQILSEHRVPQYKYSRSQEEYR